MPLIAPMFPSEDTIKLRHVVKMLANRSNNIITANNVYLANNSDATTYAFI